MKILVVGTGYVGLVTGACFAEMGHHVTCLDIDKAKVKMLKKGHIPIYEPGLDNIVKRNVKGNRLFFTTSYHDAKDCHVCFLAVCSPSSDDGSCDISYVEQAAKDIATHKDEYFIIVTKSTVPVGTADHIKKIVRKTLDDRGVNIPFDIVSNPEFLKEGSAVPDCLKPDRIVIGLDSEKAAKIMKEIYTPFMLDHDRIIEMDIPSAEMTKYAANAMLATRISFMNEIAKICKKVNANINNVRKGIGADSRIGYSFLYAGIGYGGSCFPKDIRALIATAISVGVEPELLLSVDSINNKQKRVLLKNIESYFSKMGGVQGKTIAIWGLSFKPETDDIREAPSLTLIKYLQEKGATLRLFDPISIENTKIHFKNHKGLVWCKDEFDAAKGADGIALLTEWKQFRLVNFKDIIKKMRHGVMFDGRNQYKPHEMKDQGFNYIGIGMPDLVDK